MTIEQKNALIDLINQVRETLDKYNIEFWLDCGTLLGAVRENQFLEWENDIDLGVYQKDMTEDIQKLLKRDLCDRGFTVYIAKDYINYISIRSKEVILDINFYQISDHMAIFPRLDPKNLIGTYLVTFLKTLSSPNYYEIDFKKKFNRSVRSVLVVISRVLPLVIRTILTKIVLAIYKQVGSKDTSWVVPKGYFMNLSSMNFCGMEFKVPDKLEEYLAYRYGENWKIPKSEWVSCTDDGAALKWKSAGY